MVRALLIAALWSVAAWALAGDFITARAWHDDAEGSQRYPEVAAQQFTPYERTLSRGFHAGAVWMRLHVDATAANSDALVLRVSPNHLVLVVFFVLVLFATLLCLVVVCVF